MWKYTIKSIKKDLAMNRNIDVSVLMSVYNEKPKWLIESIESIINQTYSKFEFIIILDNPLNLGLKSIIENYKLRDDRIKFLINSENKGLVYSLNRGLREAVGKYILRIDADDIAMSDRIQEQINFLNNNNEYSLIGSNYKIINEQGDIIRDNIRTISNFNLLKVALRYRNIMCHPSYMFVREDILSIGGYREIKFAEDYDLVLRLIMNGKKITNINKKLLHYRVRKDGISKSNSIVQKLVSFEIQNSYKKNIIPNKINFRKKSILGLKVRDYKNKICYKIIEYINLLYLEKRKR